MALSAAATHVGEFIYYGVFPPRDLAARKCAKRGCHGGGDDDSALHGLHRNSRRDELMLAPWAAERRAERRAELPLRHLTLLMTDLQSWSRP